MPSPTTLTKHQQQIKTHLIKCSQIKATLPGLEHKIPEIMNYYADAKLGVILEPVEYKLDPDENVILHLAAGQLVLFTKCEWMPTFGVIVYDATTDTNLATEKAKIKSLE